MTSYLKTFALSIVATAALAGGAQAATVVTQTRIDHRPIPGPTVVDFRTYDINRDGFLSMQEVGENLFYVFDRDGNQLIDNIEFDHPMVLTFAPMEKQTIQFIDFNSDGIADRTTTTREMFIQQTGLSRFDRGDGGLSAADFINKPMKKVDRDLSGQIDIKEWKEAYYASLRPLPQNDTFRYNE